MASIAAPLPLPFDGDDVQGALQRLPARHRAALQLRFGDGLSERAVADVLGCRPITVHHMLIRGLRRVRVQLAREGAADSHLLYARARNARPPSPLSR